MFCRPLVYHKSVKWVEESDELKKQLERIHLKVPHEMNPLDIKYNIPSLKVWLMLWSELYENRSRGWSIN